MTVPIRRRARTATVTSRFGSSRRESHDASGFYERFTPPGTSDDDTVVRPSKLDVIYEHDARDMHMVESSSVALVVTSPPYFAGKEYEASLGANGDPATYVEYLELLTDVFAECARVLEPGGRIAVNVANLGRRPFRSLAGDVTAILERLGLLLRGEVVWWKGRAAGGSCAWGSYQSPINPVLRDVTERIVIASKGRFDRARKPEQRRAEGLPWKATITRDEFLDATTDLWEIAPASATRVGHPAPFPVELPQRLIELYTYEGDVVLDPFMGAGTAAVAAVRTGRHYLGFETDPGYVARALERIAAEEARLHATEPAPVADPFEEARRAGAQASALARTLLAQCGFVDVRTGAKVGPVTTDLAAHDAGGDEWLFDVVGGFTSVPSGLSRSDALWRAIGRAAVIAASAPTRFVLLTTDLPKRTSALGRALDAVRGEGRAIVDVIDMLSSNDRARLAALAAGRR